MESNKNIKHDIGENQRIIKRISMFLRKEAERSISEVEDREHLIGIYLKSVMRKISQSKLNRASKIKRHLQSAY